MTHPTGTTRRLHRSLTAPLLAALLLVALAFSSGRDLTARAAPLPQAPTSSALQPSSPAPSSTTVLHPSGDSPNPRVLVDVFWMVIGVGVVMSLGWLGLNHARRQATDDEPIDSLIDE